MNVSLYAIRYSFQQTMPNEIQCNFLKEREIMPLCHLLQTNVNQYNGKIQKKPEMVSFNTHSEKCHILCRMKNLFLVSGLLY